MDFLGKRAILFVGVLFHLAFLMSIFDIYFVSPLTHGMKHWESVKKAPAQRLFLVVGMINKYISNSLTSDSSDSNGSYC